LIENAGFRMRYFEALAEAGLFRLWLPVAMGGPELPPLEFLRVVEAASAIDGSIGWIVANGAGMSRVAGYVPESTGRDWFADPCAFIVSATGAVGSAQTVEGGYRVTGRWPFGSGASHGTRFMGLAAVKDGSNSSQPPICCYFAREQVLIHDTWHVSGLRGTASCDFEVTDAFVPADHTHDFIAPAGFTLPDTSPVDISLVDRRSTARNCERCHGCVREARDSE
jgi:alkylation response protein AidB-like acyl-CoA dehydrogenase